MSLIAKRFGASPAAAAMLERRYIQHWFRFDHLSSKQGITLLIGIIPEDLNIEATSEFDEMASIDKSNLEFCINLLNGGEIRTFDPIIDAEEGSDLIQEDEEIYENFERARDQLKPFVFKYRQYMEYWNTGILEYWNTGILEFWNSGILENILI